ncbi:MAG TPA: hypothetical protein VM221_06895, partial [Armatimonadota bacterium]|nr:hypothetical protein [Armatimonadota bacterium]
MKRFEEGTQLWIMNADGSGAKAISRLGWQGDYGWSPDRKKIMYSYAARRDYSLEASLHMYDVESGQSRQLASGYPLARLNRGWGIAAFTKDSKQFALLMKRTADDSLLTDSYLFDAETGRCVGLTPNNYTTSRRYPGSWSPDDQQLAVISTSSPEANSRLWVCSRDGTRLYPITPADWGVRKEPRWSPQGEWIAFCTTHDRLVDESELRDIWLTRPDGKDAHPITHGSSPSKAKRMSFDDLEWAANGRYIACVGSRFDEAGVDYNGIYLIDVESEELTPVLANDPDSDQVIKGLDGKLSVSADGRRLAFNVMQSTVLGRKSGNPTYQDVRHILYYYDIPSRTLHEVLRTRPEQDGLALWSGGFDWAPFWSPDGERLLFTKARAISLTEGKYEPDLYVYEVEPAAAPVAPAPPAPAETPAAAPSPGATPSGVANALARSEDRASTAAAGVVILPVRHRDAADVANLLPPKYSGLYTVDKAHNAIVVSADPEMTQ